MNFKVPSNPNHSMIRKEGKMFFVVFVQISLDSDLLITTTQWFQTYILSLPLVIFS